MPEELKIPNIKQKFFTDEQTEAIYMVRDKTGVGVKRCQEALEKNGWDIDLAIKSLGVDDIFHKV
jgi:translation elongation factor EF-Ts